ncbi:hypothetical protein JCM10908_005575 [Rhodotorula pacifica]|uniref:uncharacterized protein n=1 Tax=Rhodotorula pacifica TaxID=1495444 RepID=UPI00317C29CF
MAKPPADTLALTDYFQSPDKRASTTHKRSSASSSNSRSSQSKRPKLATGKAAPTTGREENLGEVTLSDSDDDADGEQANHVEDRNHRKDDNDDDDLVILDPVPSTSKVKLEDNAAMTAKKGKLAPPPTPIKKETRVASIFAPKRQPSAASTSPQRSASSATTVKKELATEADGDADRKPDIKPSPSKSIAIFDTAAATATGSSTASSSSTSNLPLDTSLFSFHPSQDISFSPHARIPFSFFTDALVLISSTKSRLYIQLVLTNLLRTVIEHDPASLVSVIYLCSNRIGPSYEPQTELGIGWQVLSKSIKETSGATPQKLKQLANKYGDPGDIAFDASKSVRLLVQPAPLLCHSVYATLLQIARLKGTGVLNQKTSLVKKLLLSATGEQVRYIVRILASNLRIGAVRLSLLSALARAFVVSRPPGKEPPLERLDEDGGGKYWLSAKERAEMRRVEQEEEEKAAAKATKKGGGKGKGKVKAESAEEEGEAIPTTEDKIKNKIKTKPRAQKSQLELRVEDKFKTAEQLVRRVWAKHPNFGHLVEALLEGGLEELENRVGLSVGVPLEPMLGSITRSFDDIYTRLGSRPFVSEAKLDGQRGQIHVWVGEKRPPGVADNAGKWFVDEKGTTGRKVWVRMFSRHLEDMSEKYPDIGGTILGIVERSEATETPLRNFVIDCEVVAIDPVSGAFKTFQELSYRSKKDVELGDIKVRVGIFCFDLMFLNDESLLSTPFRGRRQLLHTLFPPLRPTDPRYAKWELIPSCTDIEPEKVRAFFHEALKMKAEGIMVKLLDEVELEVEVKEGQQDDGVDGEGDEDEFRYASSENENGKSPSPEDVKPLLATDANGPAKKGKSRRKVLPATYEPDKRADSWLKVKKDYLEGEGAISDSLDLVPIAAWWGQGRKAGWWSPFLLAAYDEETGAYTAVTKCLSGFTDAFYKEMREKYSPDPENLLTSHEPWPEVDGGSLRPDIWFKPSEVWEIRGADFTLSPVYPAARSLLGERGCSIRFPRFIKVREDKGIENATTAEQLARMYHMQGEPAAGGGGTATVPAGETAAEEEEEGGEVE